MSGSYIAIDNPITLIINAEGLLCLSRPTTQRPNSLENTLYFKNCALMLVTDEMSQAPMPQAPMSHAPLPQAPMCQGGSAPVANVPGANPQARTYWREGHLLWSGVECLLA